MRILYPNSGSHPRYCSQQHGTEVWAQRKGKTHAQALVQNSPSPRCAQGLPGPRMRDSPPPLFVAPAVGTLEAWAFPFRPHRTTASEPTTAPRGLCLSLPGLSLPLLVGPGLGDGWVRVVVGQGRSSPSPGTPAHTTPNVALTQKLKHVQGGRGWEPKGKKREKRERGSSSSHESSLKDRCLAVLQDYYLSTRFIHQESGKCTVQPSSRLHPVR
ncbi:hypothetical protein CPAR01_08829 [Colletotrichum paranaense]|uniref:Uncharacterized protein n=1 Tax=Colletotrichum paranaense TaxID=1914294 RepID=A0ABQ9SF81_9PEZI|nr:uncharacterized protein CPAR01_08829 [Colletotrichum paranaense]KAK1535287.1 hypothetical protein CPAR01_08829 [Colletotrichum paranaense]